MQRKEQRSCDDVGTEGCGIAMCEMYSNKGMGGSCRLSGLRQCNAGEHKLPSQPGGAVV